MSELITTIGVETHVQLSTASKLFCSCNNDAREAKPNTLVCPVCMGLPGTLPVLNHQAVRLALRAGVALGAEIPELTKFDRKNYFYPDLPKGYQITQLDLPIVGSGKVQFPLGGKTISVGITRAHMEEDAGKLIHPDGKDYSLVDLNRAGTPLMEVVSEPDMHSAAEAKAYAQEIYNLMRAAGVSDANLYYGNMRFDVNVSVAPAGELGTRTETKNLNSFRAVEKAVEYEVARQSELIGKSQKIVQETRGWDEAKGKTFPQRSKEDAHDYRYFPEPDLPPVVVTAAMLDEAKRDIGPLPAEYRQVFTAGGIDHTIAETLITSGYAWYLYHVIKEAPDHAKRLANWLTTDIPAIKSQQQSGHEVMEVGVDELIELAGLVADGSLSNSAAKRVLEEILVNCSTDSPKAIAGQLNLTQDSDSGSLGAIVDGVIKDNPGAVEDYKAGKENAHKFLVGQVMKASRGQANPPMVNDILKQKLDS